jgi:hypothetical protein
VEQGHADQLTALADTVADLVQATLSPLTSPASPR